MPENIISLATVRKAREPKAERQDYVMVKTAVAISTTFRGGRSCGVLFMHQGSVMFARWLGPTGRDYKGRFVAKGSPQESFLLDIGLKYRQADMGKFRILGRVKEGDSHRTVHVIPASSGCLTLSENSQECAVQNTANCVIRCLIRTVREPMLQ